MKKEFARFFGDKRLVFTTILMPGLMIYILYTLLGQGIMKQFAVFYNFLQFLHGSFFSVFFQTVEDVGQFFRYIFEY